MPSLNIFKKSSSNADPPESSSSREVPGRETDEEGASQATAVTLDDAIPAYADSLKEAWAGAFQKPPETQRAERSLNVIEKAQDTLAPLQGQLVNRFTVTMEAVMDTPQIAETIQNGVNTFMEAVPSLMKALDEVAKIHPFISVAVLAFKAVYTLEKKRRENDKRVLALYVEMQDMMAVLIHLKDVSDPKQIAPDGQTIEGRMQKLCETAAEDIKKCANACDAFLKKKILVKIFAGPIWEGRLIEFVGTFTKRREEFEFALTLHTTVGVDLANLKLDSVNERTAELSRKMDVILQLFQDFVTPQQRKLAVMVERMGGESALQNERAMRELSGAESALAAQAGSEGRPAGGRPFDFIELQQEIMGDPGEAIRKNADFFNRKFDIQRRHIVEDIAREVNREGDRIISAVTAGPHDRIVDPDIYEIWRDMGWRGSVKARHFVMALRDYYVEGAAGYSGCLMSSDRWAIKYINIGRARNILEAFDDDSSGFVTVNEVNNFTRSRPLNWSLPHWIAYWAIGWQMTCTSYCVQIEEIHDAMIRLAYEVLPENQRAISAYIDITWHLVTVFVQSIKREEGTEELKSKFGSHVAAEEARLRRNFEDINYRIDNSDTFRVISGEGRIEMTLFPMFYLALKRDLEKISLARKHVLSDREMIETFATIHSISAAGLDRIKTLRSIFQEQNLEVKDQFKIFASGLYNLGSVAEYVFRGVKLRELPDPIPCRDEIIPDPDSIPLSVLNYPPGKRHEIKFSALDPPEVTLSPAEGASPVLGVYYGFIYIEGRPTDPMIKLALTAGDGERTFVSAAAHHRGGRYKHCKITGNWGSPSENGKIPLEIKMAYGYGEIVDTELKGVFDPEENSLRGATTLPSQGLVGEFVFKRHPDFVRFYPAPSIINARKRWKFATTSVLDHVRRRAWSPNHILKRIKDGKRYMELALRGYYGKSLTKDEKEEYHALLLNLYEADAQFYASLIRINLSKIPVFSMIRCDNCESIPGGSKITCIECYNEDDSVDLCSDLECINSTVKFEGENRKAHLPSHGMFKIRRRVFDRDMGRIERLSKDALDSARGTISQLKKEGKPMPECVHCKKAVPLPCWCCVECTGEKFICDDCEHEQLAFDETHTRMHTVVRVSEKVEEEVLSTEERLRLVEDKLAKMMQILTKLVDKSTEGSRGEPLTKGDLQEAVTEVRSASALLEGKSGSSG